MRTVEVMSLLQMLQIYFTPPPDEDSDARGAPLALVIRPITHCSILRSIGVV